MRKVENTIGDIGKEEACSTTAPANHTELGAESFIFPFFCEVESERVGLVISYLRLFVKDAMRSTHLLKVQKKLISVGANPFCCNMRWREQPTPGNQTGHNLIGNHWTKTNQILR